MSNLDKKALAEMMENSVGLIELTDEELQGVSGGKKKPKVTVECEDDSKTTTVTIEF